MVVVVMTLGRRCGGVGVGAAVGGEDYVPGVEHAWYPAKEAQEEVDEEVEAAALF